MQNNDFSRKKLTFRAQQRSEVLREKYISELSIYAPDMFIFVDVTGVHHYVSIAML